MRHCHPLKVLANTKTMVPSEGFKSKTKYRAIVQDCFVEGRIGHRWIFSCAENESRDNHGSKRSSYKGAGRRLHNLVSEIQRGNIQRLHLCERTGFDTNMAHECYWTSWSRSTLALCHAGSGAAIVTSQTS